MRKSKDGIIVSFVLHPDDVSQAIMGAPIGTVYLAALVEQAPGVVREPVKVDHRLSKQAAMVCEEPRFHAFLEEEYHDLRLAADVVREITGVQSRSEFDTNPAAAERWQSLHGRYLAWLQT
jgi:hypothetical protein